MKRRALVITWVLFLVVALYGCSQRATSTDDLTFELVDGEITITGYVGTERKIVIPNEIENRPVTKIAPYAFAGYDMTSIELPKTLVEIGAFSFEDCNCLTEIEIPNEVEIIGEGAFSHCDVLEKVILPTALERIDDGAFNHCQNMKEIDLPTEMDYLGVGALAYCDALFQKEFRRTELNYVSYIEGAEAYALNETYTYAASSENEETRTAYSEYTGGSDMAVTVTRYDDAGREIYAKTTLNDGSEIVTQWEYDEKNNSVKVTYSYGVCTVTYYDDNDRLKRYEYYENGELYECTDYSGNWCIDYAVTENYIEGTIKHTLYECDAYGRWVSGVTSIEGASAPYEKVEYTYDNYGNMTGERVHSYINDQITHTEFKYEEVR